MQSHEERADQMLQIAGGSMDIPAQRVTLRRLILAEDAVVEYKALVQRMNENIDYLLAEQPQLRVTAGRYREETRQQRELLAQALDYLNYMEDRGYSSQRALASKIRTLLET